MARVRQLMLGLASGSAFYSGLVPALGLGEITLHSALNQPLEAEIELLEVGDLGAEDMQIALAPAEVFSRTGVERLYFLNDLRFTPLLRGSRSVIRVVSSRPVREPYLNFIVELARPGGQILREYTVLLDPPGSSAFTPVAAPSHAADSSAPGAASAPAALLRSVTPPSAELGHRHQVRRGDSLWSIAAGLRRQGSTLSQQALMEGIHALNPTAFVGGDADRLMAGVELLLPDAAHAPEAAAAANAPLEAPETADIEATPAEPLTAPGPVLAPSADLQQLAEKQRQVDLELASQAAENLQLQQGLAQLQLQVQQLQEQLAQKDAQLAELAEQSAAAPLEQTAPAAAPAPQEPPLTSERDWSFVLLSAGVALLLLLGALLLAARRRRKAEPQAVRVEPQAQRPATAERAPLAAVASPVVRPAPLPQQRPPAPVDPLEAANVYIAYGRFSEARGELSKALAQHPQRADLRFRLLEVLAQLGDANAFAREEALLRAEGFEASRLDTLKARYPALQQPVQETAERPAPAQAAEAMAEPDFQLNLDDLSLDADWDLVSPFQVASPSKDKAKEEAATESDAAFSSNLRELPEVFEMHEANDDLGAFGEMEMTLPEDERLDEHFLDAFAGEADATAALQGDIEQLAGDPQSLSQLNQALAYIEQGNLAAACDVLNEVIDHGDAQQKQAARQLLAEIA